MSTRTARCGTRRSSTAAGPRWTTTPAAGPASRRCWRRSCRPGIHHIAIGPDHILFVVGLLLLGGSPGRLGLIVTAFTLGHSVTLSLAALGLVTPPASLVEPAIALSVVLVGVDNLLVGARARPAAATSGRSCWRLRAGARLRVRGRPARVRAAAGRPRLVAVRASTWGSSWASWRWSSRWVWRWPRCGVNGRSPPDVSRW